MPFDITSLLQMLGLGQQQQAPAPPSQQVSNLAQAGFPGAQQQAASQPMAAVNGQGTGDPLMLAAQLGGTPAGSPDAQALQQQILQAQQQQRRAGLGMGLLQGGLATIGSRDPYGYPSNWATALSQGAQVGQQADQQYLQNARQASQAMLAAQGAGQGLQSGSYDLQTKSKLMQLYGLSDTQALQVTMAMKSGAGLAALAKDVSNNPAYSTEQRARASMYAGMAPFSLAQMGANKVVDGIFGPAVNPSVAARNQSATALNEARTKEVPGLAASTEAKNRAVAGGMNAYSNATADTASWKQAAADAKEQAENSTGKAFANAFGTGVDVGYLQKMIYDQRHGIAIDVPSPAQVPDDGKLHGGTSADGAHVYWARKGMTVLPMIGSGGATALTMPAPEAPGTPPPDTGETPAP